MSLSLVEAEKQAPSKGSTQNTESTPATESDKKKASKKTARKSKTTAQKRNNLHKEHKPSDESDLLITTVNDGDFGFKGDTCKL